MTWLPLWIAGTAALALGAAAPESPEALLAGFEKDFRGTARVIHLVIDTERPEGHDVVGEPRQERVELWGLHDGGYPATRVLFVFAAPKRMRGTGLLIVDRDGAADEMWYHMKTWNHFKVIPSSSLKLRVPGSVLSYEDARGFLARDRYQVTAGSAPDRLAARPRTPELAADVGFDEVVVAIDRRRRMVVGLETFAPPGRRQKTYRLERSVRLGGLELPERGRFDDHQHATTSALSYRYWPLPKGVPEAVFDRRVEAGPLFDRVLAAIRGQGIVTDPQGGL